MHSGQHPVWGRSPVHVRARESVNNELNKEKMTKQTQHIFTGNEAAMAYALSAERIFGNDCDFLNNNPPVVPILVSLLFQSLEISIKHSGIASGLVSEAEARARSMRSGHGIKELATLAVEKLGGNPFDPILMALTYFNTSPDSKEIIRLMVCGNDFENTRQCYASRSLGYAQVTDGDFALVYDISSWILAVKETACNLPKTINIIAQWKASTSKSKHFAIWVDSI
jgi:hypothetical protein